jgi:hypothetical protein
MVLTFQFKAVDWMIRLQKKIQLIIIYKNLTESKRSKQCIKQVKFKSKQE